MKTMPGRPAPLGATWDGWGVNFALFSIRGQGVGDIGWFNPDGSEMTEGRWDEGFAKSLGVFLNGKAIPHPDTRGRRIADDSFYLLFNAHHEPVAFRLPRGPWGRRWTKVLDTREPLPEADERARQAGEEVEVEGGP